MKKLFVLLSIPFVAYLACNKIVEPDDSIDPHGIFFSVDGNIYRMDYDGSNRIQLTFDEQDNNNPCISSDGHYLIYETQANINRYPSGGLMYDYSVINIMDLNNIKNIRTIADENEWCSQPSLSPDGQFLVFCSHKDDHGSSIVISDVNGRQFKTLTEYGLNRNPLFTPRVNKILYVSDHDQKTNLYMIDADGTNKQQLTDTEWNINPVFSPDGSKIVWESYWDVYLMNLDGSNKVNISNNNGVFARTPSFSHNGDKVVFITEKTYNVPIEQGIREIHLVDLSSNRRETVLETGANFEPKFCPDDDMIIFSQYIDHQFYICVIKVDGSGFRRLGRGGNPCVY